MQRPNGQCQWLSSSAGGSSTAGIYKVRRFAMITTLSSCILDNGILMFSTQNTQIDSATHPLA